jgi:hypothetical protein
MNAQSAGWYPDPNDSSQLRYWSGSAWTEHRSPRAQVPPPPGPTGAWYFVITLASCGLLASVPFFHAASRLNRPRLRAVGAGMAAAILIAYLLVGLAPEDDAGSASGAFATAGGLITMAVMLVSCLLLIGLRREVYQPMTPLPPDANVSARAGIEAARRRRAEARALAERDPLMARELGIGRPAAGSCYDDGGLLELNHASPDELGTVCGLPREMAERVVAARAELGRFLHVDDAIVYGEIGEEHVPLVRDPGIVIADR